MTNTARDLDGRVFLVTGGTEGIGKAAALQFAQRGATLVLVGRNKEKTTRVIEELKSHSGNSKIEPIFADLSTIAEVRRVAAEFRAKYDRLDVLVNNAGAMFTEYGLTSDGYERTFALNHLSYFVLTTELLDLLRKTKGSRVVSTSSDAHQTGRIDLTSIAKRAGGAGWRAYGDSKLANILFTIELAKKLEGCDTIAACFHPGFVHTGFGHNNGGFTSRIVGLGQRLFARTPEKGAETLVWLATSPEVTRAGAHGEYFYDRTVRRRSRYARDHEMAAKLWAYSETLCPKPAEGSAVASASVSA